MKPGDAASLAKYVVQQAPKYRLDPNAVIAVALQEGISGKAGDNNSSFGPWQLHKGGAYPASAPQDPTRANEWAWSKPGIDYALGRMSSVAGGLKGPAAVRAIVYSFERPQNPAAEYSAAVKALPRSDGGPSSGGGGVTHLIESGASSALNAVPGGPVIAGLAGSASGVVSTAESVGGFLGKLTQASFWIRALEVVGGGIFVLVGIYLLARQVGLAPSASQVAMATPQGRALAETTEGAQIARVAA